MTIKLKSGREINPYDDIVGRSSSGEIELREGYDGKLRTTEHLVLTQDELIEVADLMITRWTAVRAQFAAGERPSDYEDAWAEYLT